MTLVTKGVISFHCWKKQEALKREKKTNTNPEGGEEKKKEVQPFNWY